MNIIIVEDDATQRDVYQEILEENGHHVTAFDTPEKALTTMRQSGANAPDILITDYSMPGMNGVDFVRTLKAEQPYKNLPVMMITAQDMTEKLSKERRDAGITAVFSKGALSINMLEIALQSVIRKEKDLSQRDDRTQKSSDGTTSWMGI